MAGPWSSSNTAVASNLIAMASTLLAMASNLITLDSHSVPWPYARLDITYVGDNQKLKPCQEAKA